MGLLRTLTLGYVAVLVSALAGSLIAILVQLRRIGGALDDVKSVLIRVRDETAPLSSHLEPVRDASEVLGDRMAATRTSLEHADDVLGTLAEQPGGAS